tara:strand:- start:3676 stop:3879 length:204 start_codon:yes stop_codon:yes gene_type:complete
MKPCRDGKHTFREISRQQLLFDEFAVVRWCKFCGSIVIDSELDGRVYPGKYLKIQNPELMKGLVREE